MNFERLSDKNMFLLPELFKKASGIKYTTTFFEKKYGSALFGHSNLGYLITLKNKAIAFCCAVPQQFQYGNEVWTGAQLVDGLTHPDHREKGLFTKLTHLIVELLEQEKFSFLIGFPNQHSAGILFTKSGFKQLDNMYFFEVPTGLGKLEQVAGKLALLKSKNRKIMLDEFQENNGVFNNPVLREGFAGTLRNQEYYTYKKFTGNKICEINATTMWLKAGHQLSIGEISCGNELQLANTISTLKEKAAFAGIREIVYQCSAGTKAFNQFSTLYEPHPSWPVAVYDFNSGFPFEKMKLSYADVDVF